MIEIEELLTIPTFDETIERNVLDQAALLDERNPGWHEKVNLDTMRIESGNNCLLIQVYGNFFRGLEALGHSSAQPGHLPVAFCSSHATPMWRDLITARRERTPA